MGLGSRLMWRRFLGRLDVRSKSDGAIAFCARAQISGGATQGLVAVLTCIIFWEGGDGPLLLGWTLAVTVMSLFRSLSSVWLLRNMGNRRSAGIWGRANEVNFLFQGMAWASLAWMPYDGQDFGALFLVFFIPMGIVAAATHNLSALPLGLAALSYPIAISHFFGGLFLLGGPTGLLLAICAVIYIVVTTAGAHMSNATLVNECRLTRINNFIAARSRATVQELREVQSRLMEANRRLEQLASHDPLTGLANRRALMERLEQERARSSRTGSGFSLLLIDLDHFKAVNDGNGHQVGDAVLEEAARRISEGLRASDLAARHGGEEFAVLLAETGLADAVTVAERIRARLRDGSIQVCDSSVLITGSIGVAAWQGDRDRVDAIMSRADQALYAAKALGRDRVELAEAPAIMPRQILASSP